MDLLRILLSICVFCISAYLAVDLFVYGFSLPVLLFCIGGFVLVHFLRPKKSSVDNGFYEIVDLVLDLPYRTIATIIRSMEGCSAMEMVGSIWISDGIF